MNFDITPRALDYIRNKGAAVTLRLDRRETGCSCCGESVVEIPAVKLGTPQEASGEYRKISRMNIDLFVHESIRAILEQASPRIDVEGTLFGKKLVLYGLQQS
ncbi:CC/Se motif family (seleno)protein [Anaeroselena agilis]|uniref:CC/Se motif family (Seleno)protein n=1 Tax=Anaeroselena agilis TaxID=3063788 RepID=A0ABU3NX84_9FIRM|nr:CC/Se motif family (seleno)protein [Selenomonadales bacterium 4137-cl]